MADATPGIRPAASPFNQGSDVAARNDARAAAERQQVPGDARSDRTRGNAAADNNSARAQADRAREAQAAETPRGAAEPGRGVNIDLFA